MEAQPVDNEGTAAQGEEAQPLADESNSSTEGFGYETPEVSEEPAQSAEPGEQAATQTDTNGDIPPWVKQRLGRDKKQHEKQIRQLKQEMQEREQWMMQQMQQSPTQSSSGYDGGTPLDPNAAPQGVDLRQEVRTVLNEVESQKRQKEQENQQQQNNQYMQQKINEFEDKLIDASVKYKDFDDVFNNSEVNVSPQMMEASMYLDNGADVLYYLGKNPKEASRISRLHPFDQAREMVGMGTKLGNRPAPSQAPAPISPLNKGSNPPPSGTSMNYAHVKDRVRQRTRKR